MPDPVRQPEPLKRPASSLVLACSLLALAVAGLLAFWLRDASVLSGMDQLLVLGLVLAAALGGLLQALVLRRARVRLAALESALADCGSERKNLALTEARLEGVLQAASRVAIIATDRQGVIQVFNSGAEHILGYAASEVVGRKTPTAFHQASEMEAHGRVLSERLGRTVRGFEVFVTLAREAGILEAQEWTWVRKDGKHVPVSLTVVGMHSPAGELEGLLGLGQDLSEQKALEAGLRQAQASVDNAQDMIFWIGALDGGFAYANEAVARHLGYSCAELLDMSVFDLNPARTPENWQETVRLLRSQERSVWQGEFLRKDGSVLPVEVNAAFVRHGGRDYVLSIVRDITERKQAEQRLEREARLNRSLAELARALIAPAPDMGAIANGLLDRARELTGSRHGYVFILDHKTGELVPHSMTAIMSAGECAVAASPGMFPQAVDGVYPGLWGHSLNTRLGFFDNNPEAHPAARGLPMGHVPLERFLAAPAVTKGRLAGQIALANPERDYDLADLEAVAALADVLALGVEQILAQQALLAAKEAAESSSRAKDQFLASMSHEIRTPINGMLGMLQVLQGMGLSPEQQECVQAAMESGERLHLLFSNVLEYARLDATEAAPRGRTFPTMDLLNALAATMAPQAQAKGLAFSVVADPDLPQLIQSTPEILRSILTHLLDNAIKFTSTGAVCLTVAVEYPDQTQALIFRVEDSGVGIPKDRREAVFEAFMQADVGSTRTYGGAGLGLAIARRLARHLGGDITAGDRPGGGTVMTVTVPLNCVL